VAIGAIQGASGFYDVNRDMYLSQREMHEREMFYRRQEDEYRRMQLAACSPQQQLLPGDAIKPKKAPEPSWQSNTTLLLTGEIA
jgi:hypothetical protein